MNKQIFNKISFFKGQSDLINIMSMYRYGSLVMTSIFFLVEGTDHFIARRIFIISCITLSSIILNRLYIKSKNETRQIKILVFIEILGNIIILIPSGGLNSPYVWYTLNTILIASVFLKKSYCWINLCMYIFSSTWVSYFILDTTDNFINTIIEQSNLILSLILITAMIQLLSIYAKKIEKERTKLVKTNNELIKTNDKVRKSMDYIMDLYQTVSLFTSEREKSNLIKLVVDYTQKITGNHSIISLFQPNKDNEVLIESNISSKELIEKINSEVSALWAKNSNLETPIHLVIDGHGFVFALIECNYKIFGMLGIEVPLVDEGVEDGEMIDQLKFLTQLCGIVLEKFELEQVNDDLLIKEEKNRMANEIHDGVLQKLFSISCGIFAVMQKSKKLPDTDIESDLQMIRNAMSSAMKDLRSTIYGWSWKKDGVSSFIRDIKDYIHEVKTLNHIEIDFDVRGNHELLTIDQKKALYRIISEGIGNAVRHGKADDIQVALSIETDHTALAIKDNGKGFQVSTINNEEKMGLGIRNIHSLIHTLKGEVYFKSDIGIGTTIDISIPNYKGVYKEEVV